jgi:hypothetical protein
MRGPSSPPFLSKLEQQRRWTAIKQKPGNESCAECGSRDTSWVVLEYGALICIRCAGAHRALGTHISKVRSTELDEFNEDEFAWVEAMGNSKSNGVWEAEVPACMHRPLPQSPDCIRRRWLRVKYEEQQFVAGTQHQPALPDLRAGGWLQKQGSLLPVWRRRYFCVRGAHLAYYTEESANDESLRGSLPLVGAVAAVDPEQPETLRVTCSRESGGRVLVARADSAERTEDWLWKAASGLEPGPRRIRPPRPPARPRVRARHARRRAPPVRRSITARTGRRRPATRRRWRRRASSRAADRAGRAQRPLLRAPRRRDDRLA